MPTARPLAFFAVLAAALGCGDDPADPSSVDALPIEWHFDSGLEGWASGAAPLR